MIQVNGLSRRYGSITAVSDISFSVQEGEVVGLLGANGAGKTTTMNIITGCLRATAGTVQVDGMDIETQADAVRRCIGYLPEQPPLYPDMTVNEYLQFVYALKKCRLDKQQHLDAVCTMAGLTEVCERVIRNLSKGYRQRVGLAQALIGDPKILILDEPTVGLDPKQIIEIREVIRKLRAKHTIILSSHILPEVQAVCDRILVIHEGKLVADGTPEELSARTNNAEQLQMTIEGRPDEVLRVLRAVPGTAEVQLAKQQDNVSIYCITAEADTDIRTNIFEALSQHRMAILSMQQVERSLEDIFLALTEQESAVSQPDTDSAAPSEPVKQKKTHHWLRKRGGKK